MSKRILIVVVVAAVVLATSIVADTAYGGNIPINWRVSGTIVGIQVTPLSPTGYSGPAFLIDAFLKGAPGIAQFRLLAAVAEGPPEEILECGGFGQFFQFDDMVIIFRDLSMLFAEMDPDLRAWLCFTDMEIIGGTGRYEGAEGYFQGIFGGFTFEDSGALIAEFGTIKGFIER
jgi:hypothetical protein